MLPVLRNAEGWALVTRRYSASLVELLEGLLLADPKERWSAEPAYSFCRVPARRVLSAGY